MVKSIIESNDEIYKQAQKMAKSSYMSSLSAGLSGYLPSLDGIISNVDIASEFFIGTVEIPLKKIRGTYSHSRATSFAPNFMPLAPLHSEFAEKWKRLYKVHVDEGIRDSIIAVEYMNWYYVIEGNKRVSILKYSDAFSVTAEVKRLIPKRDETDPANRLYYEFLEFNKITGVYDIWFSEERFFHRLLEYMEKSNSEPRFGNSRYVQFMRNIYDPFRKIYHAVGGGKLSITTGDAFLRYLDIYGIPETFGGDEEKKIEKLLDELKLISSNEVVRLLTRPVEPHQNVFSSLSSLMTPKKELKVAFVYSKTIDTSGWTYAHELGRLHIANIMSDQVKTSFLENIPENNEAYEYIRTLVEGGNDIIFTTSPTYILPTLKAALEFPKVRFLNCSAAHSYKNVVTFFGRSFEPGFLMGVIAGAVTKSDVIGYIAASPIAGTITGINSFAQGVKLVNPHARVKVKWNLGKEHPVPVKIMDEFFKEQCDLIFHDEQPIPGDKSIAFGLYSAVYDETEKRFVPKMQYAMSIWHWGIFYEKILRNILSGTWNTIFDIAGGQKLINFWWGMDSGLVDIFYSLTHVPRETQKLVDFLKRSIVQNDYFVFTGPVYDQKGELRVAEEEIASADMILTMDWFVDNVDGVIPPFDSTHMEPLIE